MTAEEMSILLFLLALGFVLVSIYAIWLKLKLWFINKMLDTLIPWRNNREAGLHR